jgi:hypothetical protein
MYLSRFPKSSTYATGFLVFSTMPGKLFSFLLDPTNSAEAKSTYKMFVLAGNFACKLESRKYGLILE